MRTRGGCVALLLLVAGCAGGSATPRAAATSPVPGTTTRTPTASPTTGPVRTATPGPRPSVTSSAAPTTDFGYFTAVTSSGPPVRLSFDRALFLTGDAADKAAAAHGDETPVPNDYYIVNDNTLLRTVVLAADVKVVGSLQLNSYAGESVVEPRPRTVKQLLGFLATPAGRQTAFHLVYGSGGAVVRIEEQYQP